MEGGHVLVVERHLSADQDEENHAETPHVHLGPRVGLRLEQLGSGKVEAAAIRLELPVLVRREEVAEAKVDDFDVARLADQDVLDLEVAVDDAVPVAVVDGARDLARKLAGLLLLELPVRDDVVEHLAAVDVFEEHVPVPSCPQVVPQAADVLVVEQADDCGLAGIPVLPGGVGLLAVFPALAPVVGRDALDDLARDLHDKEKKSSIRGEQSAA